MTRDVRDFATHSSPRGGYALSHPVREGVVVDVDIDNKLIRVELQPEGVPLPWMKCRPLALTLGAWTGYVMPAKGSQVLLLAKDPDARAYRYLCPLDDDDEQPAADYAAGQVLFQHQNGNLVLMDADGTVYVGGKDDAEALVMQSWVTSVFNNHTHPHPMGPTSVPSAPWTSGHVTTKSKGA